MQNAPNWLLPAILLGTTIIHGIMLWHRRQPTDNERAGLLVQLAQDAAAFVVAAFPNSSWSELVNKVVQRMLTAPGAPTKNTQALENVATAALLRLGKSPRG